MSFLKGSITFQRFKIDGPKPCLFDDVHLERLRDLRANRPYQTTPADGVKTGWAAGAHVLDNEFTQEKNVYGDHLLFDFWTEQHKLPTERLKSYYETDLKALAKDNPSGFASKKQKREAKASARERLEQEAKDGRWKKWKCVPCLWDGITNTAYFGATSCATADRFSALWGGTFAAHLFQDAQGGLLSPVTAHSLAERLFPGARDETPSAFVPVAKGEEMERPAWGSSDGCEFLGNEFLLWLWFFSEQHGDTLKLSDGTESVFMFLGGIQVEDPRGQSGRGTMNSGSAVKLPEAKAAVRSGKLPRKAGLTLVRQGAQFDFIIQAETLAVSSAKLPPYEGDGQREREMNRLDRLRDLSECIDLMYQTFLGRRLTSYWAAELKDMQSWLAAEPRRSRKAA